MYIYFYLDSWPPNLSNIPFSAEQFDEVKLWCHIRAPSDQQDLKAMALMKYIWDIWKQVGTVVTYGDEAWGRTMAMNA